MDILGTIEGLIGDAQNAVSDVQNLASGGGFRLSEFVSRMNYQSFLKTSLFTASFQGPAGLPASGRDMTMYCHAAQLPDVALSTQDVRRYGYGPVERMAFRPVFGDSSLSFIVDGQGKVLSYLQGWVNKAVRFDDYDTMSDDAGTGPYEMAYKSTYVTDLTIQVYDTTMRTVLTYLLRDAYPKEVRSVQMNWNDQDTLMSVQTVFAYTDFRILNQGNFLNTTGASVPNGSTLQSVLNQVQQVADLF